MIDLDNFKTINDTAGHAAGDAVLRQLRDILDDTCRSSDIAIRWGGDEFLLVARDSSPENLEQMAERIRSRIAEHVFEIGNGRVVRTTCSIGYACYPFLRSRLDAFTWEQVINVADRALYVAKNSGRNAWVGFHSNENTGPDGLLATLTRDPAGLVEEGSIEVRTSFASVSDLIWSQEN
jgi:diguanylate cyclase (GGDEF)-like protein